MLPNQVGKVNLHRDSLASPICEKFYQLYVDTFLLGQRLSDVITLVRTPYHVSPMNMIIDITVFFRTAVLPMYQHHQHLPAT